MRKFQKQIRQLALGVALAGIWSPQVWAQSAPEDGDEVVRDNEIIVSARRKDETVQDVPMTVNVVTDQKLKDLNLFNGSDLVNVVPGLNFTPNAGSSTPTLSLRGAARGEAAGRQDPTVQTYLNEAPVTDVMVYQAMYDIGQVEVLRGPQGTLRGRPSAAGAITFTTKRPNLTKVEGYVNAAVSTLDQWRAEGAVSVPLVTDVLAVRVAGVIDRNDNDGVKSLYFAGNPYQHLNSWRVSARFRPTDNLDINVMYQDFKSVRATLLQVYGTGYQGGAYAQLNANPLIGVAVPPGGWVNFNGPAISPFDRLSVNDGYSIRDERHKNLIGQINLDLGTHRIVYVGEYNKTRNLNYGATNVAHILPKPFPEPYLKSLDGRSKLITQEIRFESQGNKFWDYGAGFYYEKNTSDNLVESVAAQLPGSFGSPNLVVGGTPFNPGSVSLAKFNWDRYLVLTGNFPTNWKNQAIYANSTFHITPDTDLFVGARHVWYEQSSDQIGTLSGGVSGTGLTPALAQLFNQRPGGCAAIAAVPGASSAGFDSTVYPGTCDITLFPRTLYASNPLVRTEKAWVYNASLTHRFSQDLTAYATYGHSWRPATNNLNLGGTRPGVTAFAQINSETSNNFEAGLKMQFMDRKLTVNVAAFYQKYKGFLYSSLGVPYVDNSEGEAKLKVTTAAAMATNADGSVKGFDIELGFRPSSQLSLGLNVNYAKGRLSNARVPCNDSNVDGIADGGQSTIAGSFAGGTRDINYCLSNAALANQSDWKASFQGEYNMPVADNVDAYIRTLVSYTPTNNFAPGATPSDPFPVGSYALVNLFLGVRGHDGKWDVGAYARNLFNEQKQTGRSVSELGTGAAAQSALGLASASGYRTINLTPRREFGITARYSF